MLKGHGDDIYEQEEEIKANFSSNIYSKIDFSILRNHLCEAMPLIHSYPEALGDSLVRLLAERHAVENENICISNGATEAIYTLAQVYREKKTAILIPTFSEYEDACRINELKISFVQSLAEIPSDMDIVWICNPNNPTGEVFEKQRLFEFAKQHPKTTLVIDQSYQYFTQKECIVAEEISKYENIILLLSLTKQFAIPGLRLGYTLASKKEIEKMMNFRMPWAVNTLAIEAGKFLLKNDLSAQLNIANYLEETEKLRQGLSAIEGLEIFPTDTHFFLCRLSKGTASNLKKALIKNYGILIRDASNFRGLDSSYFRIATQSKAENLLLIEAIQACLK